MTFETKEVFLEPLTNCDSEMIVMTTAEARIDLQVFAGWLLDESGINWLEPIYDQVREPDEEISWEPVLEPVVTKRAA